MIRFPLRLRVFRLSSVSLVITEDELHDAIANNDVTVVVFSAKEWCVPCRRLAPHLDTVSDKMPHVKFVEVDIDRSEDIRKAYDVMAVPLVVAFRGGKLVGEVKGRTTIQLVNEISNL